MVSIPVTSPFEHAFPSAFVATMKDLVEDTALDLLLQQLCARVTVRLGPGTIGLVRFDDDGTHEVSISPIDGPASAVREVRRADGSRWGRLCASISPSVDFDAAHLDSMADFVGWLVERHSIRRRRLESIDRERQMIAGQLHDDSIQAMTAISLNLQRLARTNVPDQEQIQQLLHLTNDAIERLRHMMFSLHPPTLATDGLVVTLEDYLDGFIAPTGLRTVVTGDVTRRTPPAVEALAFRLARGAVHNSWKHARADCIEVEVAYPGGDVRVTVRDDGVGFDPSAVGHGGVGHAGIEYSRDLAADLGGSYVVVSAPGTGTTVTIVLPVT